ncbi:hypothetical protein V5799_019816 [Amblyomma americanum]|uniref:Uncharacterized protein n=1 Tax=Amblyomma americanum TaxID=6943 RepID=A0AAQ4EVM8_AMBAM
MLVPVFPPISQVMSGEATSFEGRCLCQGRFPAAVPPADCSSGRVHVSKCGHSLSLCLSHFSLSYFN